MRINPKYVQLIGDVLIPLLGYFLWDWGLYFIVVFYLIDHLLAEVLMHVKSRKIVQFQGGYHKKEWIKRGLIHTPIFLVSIVLIHVFFLRINPGIDFKAELLDFWTYEEWGIQQGYILLPLIVLTAVQQFRTFFVRTGAFKVVKATTIWKDRIIQSLFIIGGTVIALALSIVPNFIELVYVLGLFAGIVVYGLFVRK